ncbi:MAG: sulfotransferase, partial [Lentisphaeria bacterium]|nr:sulfotransferase [Lentisphaeria bacterium]
AAAVYLDSAKNNNRVLYFHRYAPEMEVKVIWLIRDGRGVVTSIMRHTGRDLTTAIAQWRTTQHSVMRTVRSLPESKVLKLYYEDLCTRPAEVMERTCRFLGLDPALMPERFGDLTLHLTGNNMRLQGLSEIRIDTRWQQTLTEADLRVFARDGGSLNRNLGY